MPEQYGSIENDAPAPTPPPPPPLPITNTAEKSSSVPTTPDDSCEDIPIEQLSSTLPIVQRIGYGFGHVFNDLCAGIWFSYTLLFLQGTLLMPSEEAGSLVMLGQIGDALATPIVGILMDKHLTKLKWHILGTGVVFIAFPLIFSICPWCSVAPEWWRIVYFSMMILMFQFGWAVVQISHLAMIPEMSRTRKDRGDLTAVRYAGSVCSNLTVYLVTWSVLHVRTQTDYTIGPSDAFRFRDIVLILTLVGLTMTILFYSSLYCNGYGNQEIIKPSYAIKRRRSPETGSIESTESSSLIPARVVSRKNFFKSSILYQNALLYVFSRLFTTTALVYIPLWLDERSWMNVIEQTDSVDDGQPLTEDAAIDHIATVPLVCFLSSFVTSIIMKTFGQSCGHRVAYLIGTVVSIIGCAWVAFAAHASSVWLFGIAILFGAGGSITMISSLCITADMIGRHADQGGFIYSAVTFADKLITGIVVIIIESIKCDTRIECPEYYRNVLSHACGAAALLGLLTLCTLHCSRASRTVVNVSPSQD